MAALTAAMLALTAANAIGSYTNQKAQSSSDAHIYGTDAALAEAQATDAIARGAEAEGRSRSQTKQTLGTQRAGYAGQGVDTGTGSAVDVAADTAALGELDAMTIRNNAKREAYGYQVQAAGFRAQQGAAQQRGRNAWTTLLTGGAQALPYAQQLGDEIKARFKKTTPAAGSGGGYNSSGGRRGSD